MHSHQETFPSKALFSLIQLPHGCAMFPLRPKRTGALSAGHEQHRAEYRGDAPKGGGRFRRAPTASGYRARSGINPPISTPQANGPPLMREEAGRP
ncbi:hypothetical protein Acsp03_38350 [Actinomadura sp. NBRC 104412]|nr:hypothetical protein Acsp03_38350 [Actinomadura sp. NBRC 104412]